MKHPKAKIEGRSACLNPETDSLHLEKIQLTALRLKALYVVWALVISSVSSSVVTVRNLFDGDFVDRNDQLLNSSQALFVFTAGVEGTGHHLFDTIFRKSPSATRLKKWLIFPEKVSRLQKTLFNNGQKELGIWSAPCVDSGKVNGTALFLNLVTNLANIDDMVTRMSITDNLPPETRTMIPLSAAGTGGSAGMMSYPDFMGNCRWLQHFDLAILYAACDAAQVHCGHVVLYRDAYEVIKSTTVNRKFAAPFAQIINLSKQLNTIHEQMLQFPNRLLGCWNYDSVSDTGVTSLGALLGWENSTNFSNTFYSNIYYEQKGLSETEKETIVAQEFRIYMEQMISGMERLDTTCAAQMDYRKES